MFVSTMSKKGYTNDLTGSTRRLSITLKDLDDNDRLDIDVKRLFSPITVHIIYANRVRRVLTLNKFDHAKFHITKQLAKKIDRIIIYDVVEGVENV